MKNSMHPLIHTGVMRVNATCLNTFKLYQQILQTYYSQSLLFLSHNLLKAIMLMELYFGREGSRGSEFCIGASAATVHMTCRVFTKVNYMFCCTVKEVAAVIRRDWKSSKTSNETSPMESLAKGK